MRPRRSQEASKKQLPLVPGGSWPPRGAKRPPRRPKWLPRGRQDGPRWTKTPPRCPKTAQVGLQNGVKVQEKSLGNSIENVMHLGIDFRKDFDWFLKGKWAKFEEKIDVKIDIKNDAKTKRAGQVLSLRHWSGTHPQLASGRRPRDTGEAAQAPWDL